MSTLRSWILASRPKTLVAAAVPVMVGAALAREAAAEHWPFALCALLAALCIQIGTNFANDYSDFRRGTDAQRIGPTRVTQSGLIAPERVKDGAILAFTLATVFGLFLVLRGGWPIMAIGILGMIFGWLYTGGPYPLGYHGLGEVFVFVFFGLAAVAGTHYVLTLEWNPISLLVAIAPGLHASALLAVNNVRDIDTDRAAGKRTLAVMHGRTFARWEYLLLCTLPFVVPVILALIGFSAWVLLSLLAMPLVIAPVRLVFTQTDGPSLIRALAVTARLQLVFGILLSLGLLL